MGWRSFRQYRRWTQHQLGYSRRHIWRLLASAIAGQIVDIRKRQRGLPACYPLRPTGAGKNIDLGTLGGSTSIANAISRNGIIVGMADDQFWVFATHDF